MGREKSIICENEFSQNGDIRSIIGSDTEVDTSKEFIAFDLKPEKVFLFDTENGERIDFDII